MTQQNPENPVEPTPETDAQKIERLEASLASANELIARLGDNVRSAAAQKSVDDATIANLNRQLADVTDRVVPQFKAIVKRYQDIPVVGNETGRALAAIKAEKLMADAAVLTSVVMGE